MPYNIYVNFKGDGKDKPLNTTQPLYAKKPKDCTEEEYKKFYTDTFMDYTDPIFWVHLDMDYPFKLKGILYFPKVKNKVELERGKVKLYCNQVFIADNIKEVIPEYLMLLNGVIDCPDIPLNVSRSFLQNDKQVQRISKYITKKVADKLNSLFKTDRAKFEECWSDLANFIKFGCIKDNDFYDKIKDVIIYKDINGKYKTIEEFLADADGSSQKVEEGSAQEGEQQAEEVKEEKADDAKKEENKTPSTIYYVSDELQQAQYVKMFKQAGMNAIMCDTFIDPHFITYLEYKDPSKLKFMRIDADVAGALKANDEGDDSVVIDIFKNALNDDKLTIKTQNLKNQSVPAIINVDEYMRRYQEMGQFYSMSDGDLAKTMVVNTSNPIIAQIKTLDGEKQKFIAKYVYSLALLSYKKLSPDELENFIGDNMQLLNDYIK
jgi:molecular chaperone HtpG